MRTGFGRSTCESVRIPEEVDFCDGVGDVERVEAFDKVAAVAVEVDLRPNEGLNLEVADFATGTSSVAGDANIETFKEVVGTDVVFQVQRKNSPRTELNGLQILPC